MCHRVAPLATPTLADSAMFFLMKYFLATAAACLFALFPLRAILRRFGVVDRPNSRSSHTLPTIRGAGIALAGIFVLTLTDLESKGEEGLWWRVTLPVALLAGISFWDDVRTLGARIRFAVQAGAAVVAVLGLMFAHKATAVPSALAVSGVAAVSILWVAGYTNAFNFMDGINGIAAVQAIATGLGTALIAYAAGLPIDHDVVVLGLVVAGAAVGFLPHNFPRASVFMGDVGSAPLGFLLALLGVWIAVETSWWMLFWVGLLHANFVLDTGITLIRRARRGEHLSEAHREHFYQRFVRAGYSHTFVTVTEGVLQCIIVLSLWVATAAPASVKIVVAAAVGMLWLAFFAFAEWKYRTAVARLST